MNSIEYRVFLDLLMCSDPWPLENGQETMQLLAARIGADYGYTDWIDAYHKHNA